jgi:hypothetical protein
MAFVPHVKLYASDGITLVYTFQAVQSINAPQTVNKSTIVEGIRGQGCIVIPGSTASFDLIISGILLADGYAAVDTLIASLESTIVMFTNYILVFDKTINTSYTYNVKRITPIEYPKSFRINDQEYNVTLKANSW